MIMGLNFTDSPDLYNCVKDSIPPVVYNMATVLTEVLMQFVAFAM